MKFVKELVLIHVHLIAALEYRAAHREGEEELVLLEEPAARVRVHRVRVVVVDRLDAVRELVLAHLRLRGAAAGRRRARALDRQREQRRVGLARELVHLADVGEVGHREVDDRAARRGAGRLNRQAFCFAAADEARGSADSARRCHARRPPRSWARNPYHCHQH